ncbi:NUDIX hydrolase [Pseudonocardia acaciae]|uniref:NUDIX hydrolase n=1 Tax=Pseudonocardia acaciae TaxID=551276 RepID=UPI000A733FA3|nr:CoA pyrophosphatase [Pseudonocardia acaciae]
MTDAEVRGARTVRTAAVLIPFYRDEGGALRMVLIERTPHGVHGGQVALPGGKHEPHDRDMRATAVRETCEELGLTPGDLDVLAELPAVRTRSTGYLVWPFVARLRSVPARWRPAEREVADVLDVDVAEVAAPSARAEQEMHFASWDTTLRVPVRRIGRHVLWGLTLRILEPVLPRALAGEYQV